MAMVDGGWRMEAGEGGQGTEDEGGLWRTSSWWTRGLIAVQSFRGVIKLHVVKSPSPSPSPRVQGALPLLFGPL